MDPLTRYTSLVDDNPPPATRRFRLALGVCAFSLIAIQISQAQPANLELTGPAISAGTYTYAATGDITAETAFAVSGNASVTFRAGQTIDLKLGFHATAPTGGSTPTFHALIGATTSGPIITSLSSYSGPTGTPLTITGSNFGTGTLTFFSAPPIPYTSTSNGTIINTSVPTGTLTGPVFVTVGAQNSNAVNFTVTAGSSTTTKEYIRLGGRVVAIETTIH